MSAPIRAADKARFESLQQIGCIVCWIKLGVRTPAQIHHLLTGQGMSQRAPHQVTIPLCYDHHQGRFGVHKMGVRAWERYVGNTELELLAITNTELEWIAA